MARKKEIQQIQKKPIKNVRKKIKPEKKQEEVPYQNKIPQRLKKIRGQGINSERKTTQGPSRRLYLQELGKYDIRRMARAGGVKRIGSDVYDIIRDIFGNCLHNIIKVSLIYKECAGRNTVQRRDVYEAARRYGLTTAMSHQA